MPLSDQLIFHAERSRQTGRHATAILCEQAAAEVKALEAFKADAFKAHPNLDLDVQRVRDLQKLEAEHSGAANA